MITDKNIKIAGEITMWFIKWFFIILLYVMVGNSVYAFYSQFTTQETGWTSEAKFVFVVGTTITLNFIYTVFIYQFFKKKDNGNN